MEKKLYTQPQVTAQTVLADTSVMLLGSGSAPEAGKSSAPAHMPLNRMDSVLSTHPL